MVVVFDKPYLQELYSEGKTSSRHYRFQPQIVSKYIKIINVMRNAVNVKDLNRIGGLHYEHLIGDKKGLSSVRINDQYRVIFEEETQGDQEITTILNIIELSNHYQ